jgi:phospholipase A1/A2
MVRAIHASVPLLAFSLSWISAPSMADAEEMRVQQGLDACRRIEDVERRLACYDELAGISAIDQPVAVEAVEPPQETDVHTAETAEFTGQANDQAAMFPLRRRSLTQRFELDDASHGGLLRLRTYYPIYVLLANWSDGRNEQPSTPTQQSEQFDLDSTEVRFQLSLKTKLLDNVIGDNGDFWAAYTQESNWQAYNGDSAPFRETNYMPEVFMTWRTGIDLGPLRWQFVNLGLIHQSNGRGQDLSRSWNRFYAMFGLEGQNTDVYFRPWVRVLTESDDDNPDIEDYLGHGDLRVVHRWGQHDLSLMGRYNFGENKGAVELGWHWPLRGDLKGYARVFSGYGDSLIDYNHNQTTVGIGASLVQW